MSELRQDLVSGDWIILAPERAGRPAWINKKKVPRKPKPKGTCPFEDLKKSGNWPPILTWPNEKKWQIAVIPNRYPALRHAAGCSKLLERGPYKVRSGVGSHELVVTKGHWKTAADLTGQEMARVFEVLQERYRILTKNECNVYASTFFNWGPTAGSTLYHNHYQVLTLPIVPPDVAHSLRGSRRYYQKHKRCAHCVMLKFDIKEKKRIIDQNSRAIAVAPYVSRVPFEVRIFPKRQLPYFEKTPLSDLAAVATVLQSVLRRINKDLGDPDLNFFIHTAPLGGEGYDYYHWHIEITPKISIWGGLELSTGVDINIVDPGRAAAVLRGEKLKLK